MLSYLAMNASEAGGDLALIKTSLLFSGKCLLVPGGGWVLPYMGYIGMCRGIGYGF